MALKRKNNKYNKSFVEDICVVYIENSRIQGQYLNTIHKIRNYIKTNYANSVHTSMRLSFY